MFAFQYKKNLGFTLIELVTVIIILGVLSAVAMPKLTNFGKAARVASVKHLAGSLRATANLVHAKCLASTDCDETLATDRATFDGIVYWVNYGWLDAGNTLNDRQVDQHINYSGFTPVLVGYTTTRFDLINAPTPLNCSVSYHDVFYAAGQSVTIETDVSGC